MKKLQTLILNVLLMVCFTQCKTLLPLPNEPTRYSAEESKRIIERVLNQQTKHIPLSVYVDTLFYKVAYASAAITGRQVYKFVYFNDIGELKIYKYPHYYNLVIYTKKGREINKVLSKSLEDLHKMVYAIRSLQ